MPYDMFISYTSDDRSWAAKLEADLTARGLNVFRDQTRLDIGKDWDESLRQALSESMFLVVVWSAKAFKSPWVQKELAWFEATKGPQRRLIALLMDDQSTAYGRYQAIDDLKRAGSYSSDPASVDANLWSSVLARIEAAVRAEDGSVPIHTAVLTLTQNEWNQQAAHKVDEVCQIVGIPRDTLLERYGANRLDWKPYGEGLTIRARADEMLGRINDGLKNSPLDERGATLRFRCQMISEEFWNPPSMVMAATWFGGDALSVVIVDAVALQFVFPQFTTLQGKATSDRSVWVIVPPYAFDPRQIGYRNVVRNWGMPLLEGYYEPPVPTPRSAPHMNINCGDAEELRRMVRGAIGCFAARLMKKEMAPYLTPPSGVAS
jgi:hypothetical protein